MNSIGHNAIFIYNHIFIVFRYLENALFHNFACVGKQYILRADIIRPYAAPEAFLPIYGANRNKYALAVE